MNEVQQTPLPESPSASPPNTSLEDIREELSAAKPVKEVDLRGESNWRKFTIETLQTIILALVLYFLIDTVVARVRVENISMLPTLQPGEFILVNKFAYRFGSPLGGDVIVFHYPANPREDFIKRVIGLPGDVVRVTGNTVYINDHPLDESYIASSPVYEGEWVVPEKNLFVLGDNRNQSSDSHSWGFVPYENVVGKALVIYWPISQLKVLNQPLVVNASAN